MLIHITACKSKGHFSVFGQIELLVPWVGTYLCCHIADVSKWHTCASNHF